MIRRAKAVSYTKSQLFIRCCHVKLSVVLLRCRLGVINRPSCRDVRLIVRGHVTATHQESSSVAAVCTMSMSP